MGTSTQSVVYVKYYSLSIMAFLYRGRVDTGGVSGMAVDGTPFDFCFRERSACAGTIGGDGLDT